VKSLSEKGSDSASVSAREKTENTDLISIQASQEFEESSNFNNKKSIIYNNSYPNINKIRVCEDIYFNNKKNYNYDNFNYIKLKSCNTPYKVTSQLISKIDSDSPKAKLSFFYKKLNIFLHYKKFILIKQIVLQRERAALKLQSYLRMAKKRKQAIYIVEKSRECYLIKCKIKLAKNVQLKVLLNDKTEKCLDFDLCPIRNTHVLYIEKKLVHEPKYYVNFIADGNIIIDPLYRTDYDKEGNFFNIIDFEKLEEEERERELERDYFYSQKGLDTLKQQNQDFFERKQFEPQSSGNNCQTSNIIKSEIKNFGFIITNLINKDMDLTSEFNSSKDDSGIDYSSDSNIKNGILNNNNQNSYRNHTHSDEEKDKENINSHYNNTVSFSDNRYEKDLDDNCRLIAHAPIQEYDKYDNERTPKKDLGNDMNLIKLKKRNSIEISGLYKRNSLININKGAGIKHVFSTMNIKPQKSILKSPSSGCKKNIPKRVSFGNVQFSK